MLPCCAELREPGRNQRAMGADVRGLGAAAEAGGSDLSSPPPSIPSASPAHAAVNEICPFSN